MPGLEPGIQGEPAPSQWPLDRRVKPGDDVVLSIRGRVMP